MAAQPKLVTNRDVTLTTTLGHSIAFKKGVPTYVPPIVYSQALAIGAVPEDGSTPTIDEPKRQNAAPLDPAVKEDQILKALEDLVARNERGDFTAAGLPAVDAVVRELGYRVTAKEIAAVWQIINDTKANEKLP